MDIQVNKADIVGLLDWIKKNAGFNTTLIADSIRQYAAITADGITIKKRLPVGSADILIVPEVGPNGSIKIRLVQIKVLGLGFLVKQLRAMAAKAILSELSAYIDYFGSSLTDGNDILIFRADVKVTAVSYLLDQLSVSVDL